MGDFGEPGEGGIHSIGERGEQGPPGEEGELGEKGTEGPKGVPGPAGKDILWYNDLILFKARVDKQKNVANQSILFRLVHVLRLFV